ncbi:MAG: hypothetical protein ACD_10C00845G0003 [uncultured bacterium]|nr:MAG: hypothetical protein ACD_10C00845G0003 [uncultured bacterium]
MIDDLAGFIFDRVDAEPLGNDFACFAPVPELAFPESPAQQGVPHCCVEVFILPAGGENSRILANHLIFRVAGNLAESPVDRDDLVLPVGDHDAFLAIFEHLGGQAEFFRDDALQL